MGDIAFMINGALVFPLMALQPLTQKKMDWKVFVKIVNGKIRRKGYNTLKYNVKYIKTYTRFNS